MYRIFGREPAVVLALFAAVVSCASAFGLNVSADVQLYVNAAAVAAVGALTAWSVEREKLLPAITGFVQAVMILAVSLGLDLSAEKQSIVLTLVAAVGMVVVRDRVTAKVPPGGGLKAA